MKVSPIIIETWRAASELHAEHGYPVTIQRLSERLGKGKWATRVRVSQCIKAGLLDRLDSTDADSARGFVPARGVGVDSRGVVYRAVAS